MRVRVFLSISILLIIKSVFSQETFPVNGVYNKNHNYYAFTNARIQIDPQTLIEKGTLLIKDGAIVKVGEKVEVPQGCVLYDLKGKFIYPSFIDAYTSYGMPEVKKQTGVGANGWNQAIRSQFDAYTNFSVDKKQAEEFRKLGFGSVLSLQRDGIARGSAVFVTLADKKENEVIIKDKAAAAYSFDKGTSTQDYPSSLMGAIALLRQTYLDALWYKDNAGKTEFNISLAAWNELRSLPQVFEVSDKLSALRANKISKEFDVRYIIKGSGNEYQRMDEIKKTFSRFILPINFPDPYDVEDPLDALNVSMEDMKHWELAPSNPAAFQNAGISFALTTSDLKEKNDFWKNLRKAIDFGLDKKQALKALTITPAEILGVSDKTGSLREGMLANFIICNGDVFSEKTKICENWVQGTQYVINDMNGIEINGKYELKVGKDKTYDLSVKGEYSFYNYSMIVTGDTNKIAVSGKSENNSITLSYILKGEKAEVRLAGIIYGTKNASPEMSGTGQLGDGTWINWKAIYKEVVKSIPVKKDSVAAGDSLGEIIYPFTAYGENEKDKSLWQKYKERQHAILIKNVSVWTNDSVGTIKQNHDIYINEGRIVAIDSSIKPLKTAFAVTIDGTGKHLTAGIIDEHSHIAITGDVNEGTQTVTAEVRIGDVINSEDINIYRQLAGGVTAAQLLHGSANPIGGQSAIIKLRWGASPEEMKIDHADEYIKFALGENVKQSNWGDYFNTRFPQSRMGVEQVFYDIFTRAKEYEMKRNEYEFLSKKEKIVKPSPRRDLELDAVLEILNKKRFITCHSYVQSEINMLMHVADSMGFKVNTFTHILEGYKVADKMKMHGVGASTFADWWAYKMEVKDAIPYNAALLDKMGISVAVNSDDAEMGRRLNQEAAKAIKYGGLTEEEAFKLCTLYPAKLLHLDKKMGSVRVSNDADVVLWSDNPLSINAKVEKTIVDGLIVYDIDKDKKLREYIQKERNRIVQKMIVAKKAGAKTQKPLFKKRGMYKCEGVEEEN